MQVEDLVVDAEFVDVPYAAGGLRMLDGVMIDDAQIFNDKLREWEDFYNYHRPHGSLDGQTPYERLRQKMTQV